jgi:membrane glycosyltransferase
MFGRTMTAENKAGAQTTPSALAENVRYPGNRLRRLLFAVLVLATGAAGTYAMHAILGADGLSILEGMALLPFTITFSWIAIAFWSCVIGCLLWLLRREPMTLRRMQPVDSEQPIEARTAVVMPVHNETVERVAAGVEANIAELQSTGHGECFDAYVLSDSTDDAIADAERQACAAIRERAGDTVRLFYRRRDDNRGRKAGNIADFCRRWGAYYDYMIILDADSLMTGESMLALVRGMQANPAAGLIQTVPLPVRSRTFFARFLQFAATLHSPVLAAGFSFWQTNTANYWGHNAILRVTAFRECCGLPDLPGQPPLGGEILSHDFVEAALMRRGGWHCYLFTGIRGSYEEVPANMLDFAKRDRRWTQGNLQHMRVLPARGLHWLSRLHMGMGVLAFTASMLWLIMLGLSTVDAVWRAVDPEGFFTRPNQLFPDWPTSKPGLMGMLLVVTVIVLVLPKVLALLLGLLRERRAYGGAFRLLLSGILELAFSVLIAPIMMIFHSSFVVGVLMGGRVNWNPQAREGRILPWSEAFRRGLPAMVLGTLWGGVTWLWAPQFFVWLLPVVVGMVLAAPIIRISSSPLLGRWARRAGLFRTPADTNPPEVVVRVEQLLAEGPALAPAQGTRPLPLLAERPRDMPVQRLRRRPDSQAPAVPLGAPPRVGGGER